MTEEATRIIILNLLKQNYIQYYYVRVDSNINDKYKYINNKTIMRSEYSWKHKLYFNFSSYLMWNLNNKYDIFLQKILFSSKFSMGAKYHGHFHSWDNVITNTHIMHKIIFCRPKNIYQLFTCSLYVFCCWLKLGRCFHQFTIDNIKYYYRYIIYKI